MSTTTRDEQLAHFNFFDPEHFAQKWEIFDHARVHSPVALTDDAASGGPFHLLTRYDDVRTVMEDWETFSSTESPLVPTGLPSLCPIDGDPPFQADIRRLLNPLFSRSALAPFEAEMHQTPVPSSTAGSTRGGWRPSTTTPAPTSASC